jgi:hypothetical protein
MKEILKRLKKSTRFQLSLVVLLLIPLAGVALALGWVGVDAFTAVTTLAGVAVGAYISSETVDKAINGRKEE